MIDVVKSIAKIIEADGWESLYHKILVQFKGNRTLTGDSDVILDDVGTSLIVFVPALSVVDHYLIHLIGEVEQTHTDGYKK